jgi:DHA2 family multidrug resistance protein
MSSTDAQWLRVLQAGGLGFVFVPITLAAYTGLPAEKGNSISGMLNFMRNLGSSVGTSMVTTLIAQRSQVHQVTVSAYATTFNPRFRRAVAALSRHTSLRGPLSAGRARAYAAIYGGVISQATTLAYMDVFTLLAALAAMMFALSFALKRNEAGGGARVTLE